MAALVNAKAQPHHSGPKLSTKELISMSSFGYGRALLPVFTVYHSNLLSQISSTSAISFPFQTCSPEFAAATTPLRSEIIAPGPLAKTAVRP